MDGLTTESNDPAPTQQVLIRDLGRQAYEPIWHAMQEFTDTRDSDTRDEIWLVEHEPVFTQGQAGKAEHILSAGDIPVVQVDRGGQITYHGPGQIVAYPLIDLRRLGIGVRQLVCKIEQAIIDTLAAWNITAQRHEGAPGVYVGDAKIAALGLRVRRGCSFHGLAFNIAMDLSPFQRINPCGYRGLAVTQMADLDGPTQVGTVAPVLVRELCRQLGLAPVAAPTPS